MKSEIMYSALWMLVLLCLSVATIESHDESRPLCHYLKTPLIKQINVTVGNLLDDNTTERCSKPTDSCYMLWQEDLRNKTIKIVSQGCWNAINQKCHQNECIPYTKMSNTVPKTRFCCCEGNFCNSNYTDINNSSDPPPEHDPTYVGPLSYTTHIIITVLSVIAVVVVGIILFWFHRVYCTLPKRSNESLHLMEAPPPTAPNFDLDTLKIQEAVARGRYGSVYRACLNEQSVAVKLFPYQNQQHFLSERAIYILPHMDHPSIPKYIGSKEQEGEDGRPELLLVVSFSPRGCLKDFLKENTVDWNSLCKMILSVACGLAHLHSEIRKGDKVKPCIVHRDVTSRNILVKADGTCMLCDFGFAIQISGSTYILNGAEVKAEETSLADVGTLRYMAPEILEGAVNLRDCESSLKQTDVYALGLVMWEIATRCSDLYQGVEVPQYKQPYEAEVGIDPSMEQMQILVVKHKSRPLFPDIWKTTNPAIRSLKETIEDCWDQDAEARLTTLCVEERITELPVLWEWHRAGLSGPGISPSLNVSNLQKSNINNKSGNDSDFGSGSLDDHLIIPRERSNSLSECTTETLLSPSEIQNNDKNILANNIPPVSKVSYPLQPHQGRNPCLERNLLQELPDESSISGNTLLDRTLKYPTNKKMISFSDGDANMFSLPPGMESNLMPNDFSNYSNSRVNNSIPFVQNHVGCQNGAPKVTNLASNKIGRSSLKEEKRWSPLSFFDKRRFARDGIKAGLKNFLDRKTSSSNDYIPEEQQPLKSSAVIASPVSPSDCDEKHGQYNPMNSSFWTQNEPNKSSNHSTISASCNNVSSDSSCKATLDEKCKPLKSHLSEGQLIPVSNGHPPVIIDIPINHVNGVEEKIKRPTTLPVSCLKNNLDENDFIDLSDAETAKELSSITQACAESDESKTLPMRRKGSSGKRKGVKRVKTPFEIKGRLSLYDDRIMSSQELPANSSQPDQLHLDNSKFSISVPLNMNTLLTSSDTATVDKLKSKASSKITDDNPKRMNGFVQPINATAIQNVFSFCDI